MIFFCLENISFIIKNENNSKLVVTSFSRKVIVDFIKYYFQTTSGYFNSNNLMLKKHDQRGQV